MDTREYWEALRDHVALCSDGDDCVVIIHPSEEEFAVAFDILDSPDWNEDLL